MPAMSPTTFKDIRDGVFWFTVTMLFAYILGLITPPV